AASSPAADTLGTRTRTAQPVHVGVDVGVRARRPARQGRAAPQDGGESWMTEKIQRNPEAKKPENVELCVEAGLRTLQPVRDADPRYEDPRFGEVLRLEDRIVRLLCSLGAPAWFVADTVTEFVIKRNRETQEEIP